MNPLQWNLATKVALALLVIVAFALLYFFLNDDSKKTVVADFDRESPVERIPLQSSDGGYSDIPDSRGELIVYPDEDSGTEKITEETSSSYSTTEESSSNTQVEESAEEVTQKPEVSLPAPRLSSGPSGLINNASPRFAWESQGSFRCSLNSPSYKKSFACSSPYRFRNLADGSYVFRLWQVSGNSLSPAAARSFRVDRTPPGAATIIKAPSGLINERQPTFVFRGPKGAGFLCSLDQGSYRRCSSPFVTPILSDGQHRFRLQTVDRAGNRSSVVKKRIFQVDATPPPAPTILSGPEGEAIEFTFTGQEPLFLCSLNSSGPTGECSSPLTYSDLLPGEYLFRLWNKDRAGNVSQPALWSFTVSAPEIKRMRSMSRASTSNPASYATGDTSSAAGEQQSITLEIDPAIEILSIAAASDTVSPQAGGDVAEGDDASFQANIDLRSNLAWTSTAAEETAFGLVSGSLVITGDGDTGDSNGTAQVGDGIQEYTVEYTIDISWADDASSEAAPYSGSVDHDVANTLLAP